MKGRILWLAAMLLVTLSMLATACAGPGTTTAPSSATATIAPSNTTQPVSTVPSTDKPQYGGTINCALSVEPTWDLLQFGKNKAHMLSHEFLWNGDWSKGPAGGYGTNQYAWTESTNLPDGMVGMLAESLKWTANAETQEVVTKIVVRSGVHFALDPSKEASKLANGREVTADDAAFAMNEFEGNPDSQNYKAFPQTRGVRAVKTGPRELSVTFPFNIFLQSAMRLYNLTVIYPPEVYAKYGRDFSTGRMTSAPGPTSSQTMCRAA